MIDRWTTNKEPLAFLNGSESAYILHPHWIVVVGWTQWRCKPSSPLSPEVKDGIYYILYIVIHTFNSDYLEENLTPKWTGRHGSSSAKMHASSIDPIEGRSEHVRGESVSPSLSYKFVFIDAGERQRINPSDATYTHKRRGDFHLSLSLRVYDNCLGPTFFFRCLRPKKGKGQN